MGAGWRPGEDAGTIHTVIKTTNLQDEGLKLTLVASPPPFADCLTSVPSKPLSQHNSPSVNYLNLHPLLDGVHLAGLTAWFWFCVCVGWFLCYLPPGEHCTDGKEQPVGQPDVVP